MTLVTSSPPLGVWLFAVVATAAVSAVIAVVVVVVLRSMMRGGPWRGGPWPGGPWPGGPGRGPWGGPGKGPGFGPPPGWKLEHLLAERFAKGEIDEGEFRHRLEVLRSWQSERHGNWEQGDRN
jgi:putative membrane protein